LVKSNKSTLKQNRLEIKKGLILSALDGESFALKVQSGHDLLFKRLIQRKNSQKKIRFSSLWAEILYQLVFTSLSLIYISQESKLKSKKSKRKMRQDSRIF